MLRSLSFALAAICLAALASRPAVAGDDKGFVDLFNGKDLTGWKVFPDKAAKGITVKDGAIIVAGSPNGYFHTDKSFKNYVLTFDWRYQRPAKLEDDKKFGGNSGLLMHIQEPHKVWPTSLEVQGANGSHGSFIGINTKVTNYKFDSAALAKVRNKVGEWNTTEVTVKDGAVVAKVNGVVIGSGTINLKDGPLGFQAEGSEIHFKNIRIKKND
jgi:hypothetical protein